MIRLVRVPVDVTVGVALSLWRYLRCRCPDCGGTLRYSPPTRFDGDGGLWWCARPRCRYYRIES